MSVSKIVTPYTANELSDIAQIVGLKNLYGELIDKLVRNPEPGDAERLAATMTDDAVYDYGDLPLGVQTGKPDIVHLFVDTLPSELVWMSHAFFNTIVEVDGDRAQMRSMLLALAVTKAEPDKPPMQNVGRYLDHFVRGENGWQQSGLQFFNEKVY